jgi:predicted transcriptional regulator
VEDRDELMFILSSAGRVEMLYALSKENLRLSRLATRASMTVQEASRQLARLQASHLVEKDAKGSFALTLLGRSVLKLLPSFDFLVKNRDYLLVHDLTFLPPEFMERIGELAEGEYGGTLGDTLRHFQEVMGDSEEYVWLMADQVLLLDSVAEKAKRDGKVAIKVVVPSSTMHDADYATLWKEFKGNVEVGLVDDVRVGMALNEKVAGIVFPDASGRVDFGRGLRSADPSFHRWCTDLFSFHWKDARKVSFKRE